MPPPLPEDHNNASNEDPAFRRLSFERLRESLNGTPTTALPPIPSMATEAFATPLPVLSMVVLSITMLGEFLTASVSTPFILFMVKGFGTLKDDAEIAFWTGILVSTFFLTQFLTAIVWANIADVYGRRFALVVSLLGSGVTCTIFGACTTLNTAIGVRLLQGVFGGAVGVARGSVSSLTDATNEGRAYAILSFCWGLGGVTGAIVGGALEEPAIKWPKLFANTIFELHPYLLPCAVAGSVTVIGSVLGCFLAPDGGPRRSGKSDVVEKSTADDTVLADATALRSENAILGSVGPSASIGVARTRTLSSSQTTLPGYGSIGQHSRPLSGYGTRRESTGSAFRRRPTGTEISHRDSTASFAHRLFIANENSGTSMADLWVASAINSDVDDGVFTFEDDWEEGRVDAIVGDTETDSLLFSSHSPRGRLLSSSLNQPVAGSPLLHPLSTRRPSAGMRLSGLGSSFHPSPLPINIAGLRRPSFSAHPLDGTPASRRLSGVPNIFNNVGVGTPPAMLDAISLPLGEQYAAQTTPPQVDTLQPIFGSRRLSLHETQTWHTYPEPHAGEDVEVDGRARLPMLIIIQYGLLALHATTHDQVFLSYVVSDYSAGGLDLKAGNYAQLIAVMCFAQIVYQFFMYPNIGPPRGPCSHLTMFRLGSALFIPSYLAVIFLRPLASEGEDVNTILMLTLGLATAIRFCGSCFAYTAVSILLNYMTPPNAIGLANGLAQSIVSLARCFGPVIGGWLWSASTQNNPSGYPLGFFACASVCALAVGHSFMIR
ncbi:hypothetical protein C8F01DRAFT_776471 [Mycena amicta]|nr:hypothetical protein C8F01DRAFT_776471 [Mycena amicta]